MKALVSAGANKKAIQRFKPWLASITYASLRFLKLGYNPNAGVEATVIGLAQAKGIPIDGLETVKFQISLFDSMTERESTEFVKATLDNSGNLQKRMTAITEAWTAGDLDRLDGLLLKNMRKTPQMAEKIFYERNRHWSEKVEKIMANPGHVLIAVGTGHLLGDKSLLALLEEEGYSVERLH